MKKKTFFLTLRKTGEMATCTSLLHGTSYSSEHLEILDEHGQVIGSITKIYLNKLKKRCPVCVEYMKSRSYAALLGKKRQQHTQTA